MPDIPKRFPSQNTDRYINYLRGIGEMMIQMEGPLRSAHENKN
jgi:hypothetical protein